MAKKLNSDERSKLFLMRLMIKFLELNKREIGERNCDLAIRYYKGEPIDKIASEEKLSSERIRQLIKLAEAKIEKYVSFATLAKTREELVESEEYCKVLEQENKDIKITLKLNHIDSLVPLSKLEFSNRTMKILHSMNIDSIQKLCKISIIDLMLQKNAGLKTISEIETALGIYELNLEA